MDLVSCHVSSAQLQLQLRSLRPWRHRFARFTVLVPGSDDIGWAAEAVGRADIGTDWIVQPCEYDLPGESEFIPDALRTYLSCDEPLGYKLLLPVLERQPFLFMDGDVILTGDPARHLKVTYPWASRSGLDDWTKVGTIKRGDARPSQLAREIEQILGVVPSSQRRTDAAVWCLPQRVDFDDYCVWLEDFFGLIPRVMEDAEAGGNRRRTLDQKFLSTWLSSDRHASFTGGWPEGHMLHDCYRAAASWKQEAERKSLGKATFLHYCCSGRKDKAIAKYWTMLP